MPVREGVVVCSHVCWVRRLEGNRFMTTTGNLCLNVSRTPVTSGRDDGVAVARVAGSAVGVTIGGLLGMVPLMWD